MEVGWHLRLNQEKLYYNSIDKLYHNRDNFIKNQNRFNDLLQIVEAL